MAPKKNESDASGKKKDQTKAAAKSKGKGKKSGKDKKAGFRDDVAMDPMEEIRAQPMGNYTQCRERATLLEETFLREKQQYQPDSALLTLSAFESGNVFIDPYDVDLTKQANALVWKDREDVNQIGYKQMTPVWMCARMGNLPMAAYLMERNADVNMPDDEGVSPLHIAIMKGQRESIVHQLVGRTGSIDLIEQKTQAGWTPLQLCVVNCPEPSNLELIRLLLKLKADVLATNEIQSQDTAIHLAVREPRGENYEEVLEYLMFYLYKQTLALEEQGDKEGAKKMMNPQNVMGDTPLHAAGYKKAVEICLGYQLDHTIRNKDGKYAYQVCRAGPEVRSMLHSLSRKTPLPRRTDLRFDQPTLDNYYRYDGEPETRYKTFTLI